MTQDADLPVDDAAAPEPDPSRRSFSLSSLAMAGGLAAGYGMLGYIGFQFLKPQGKSKTGWMLVKPVKEFAVGDTLRYRTPDGATVNVTRRAATGDVSDFKALSSVCPHLGCQVHWEPHNNRYFCPCHNGVFDPDGVGIGGPPGDAGQTLGEFALRVDQGLLYIEVSLEVLTAEVGGSESRPTLERLAETDVSPRGPGHDPCLAPRDTKGRPA